MEWKSSKSTTRVKTTREMPGKVRVRMTADRQELFERLKLAYAEYRAEVALGWERQRLFLALNVVMTGLLASGSDTLQKRLGCAVAAIIAITGVFVVLRSHGRYRAARTTMQRLEDELGLEDLQTTGGQRAARNTPRLEHFRIVDAFVLIFLLFAAFDWALLLVHQ